MAQLDDTLAEFVSTARLDHLPARAVEATKWSLLDALGVSLAAAGLGEGCGPFVALARAVGGGTPESTIIGHDAKAAAPLAALANGALAHALDFEDAYDGAPIHPNAATVAAVLAEAEALGSDGRSVLAAIAVGCDLTCRLGLSLRGDMSKAGWYPPPILGAFGAAAALANLRRLPPRQVLDAMSLMLCQATCSAEIKYSADSAIRAVRDAFPAHAAVLSVRLAADGVRGFEHPFSGKAGFFQLYGGGDYDQHVLTAELGSRFHGERVSFKLWPACRGTHAYIEAALAARAEGVGIDEIAELRVGGGPLQRMLVEPRAQKLEPGSPINAKFSIPFALGVALVRGRVTLDDFAPERLGDERVLSIARLTRFEALPGWDHRRGDAGRLEIRLHDGRVWTREVEHALGHPEHPVSIEALVEKFVDCAARAARPVARAEAERCVAAVFALESAPDAAGSIFETLSSRRARDGDSR